MNKKILLFLLLFLLFTINTCVSQEINNQTIDNLENSIDYEVISIYNNTSVMESSNSKTYLSLESNTTFDVVGDYFKVKLTDMNNNAIKNANIVFTINDVDYNKNTDSNGISSIQLNLKDGEYYITSKYSGNSIYKSSSLTTKVLINNTKIIDKDLTNSEIQKIIDEAKDKNIILFAGDVYEDINLIINKRLTLISNSNTLLKSNSVKPVISVMDKSSSYSKIDGFNIQNDGNAIEVLNSDYIIISNNKITTNGIGIFVKNANYINITKNNLIKNSKSGITFNSISNSHIYDNNINNNGNGVELRDVNKVYVYNNIISENAVNGLLVTDESHDVYITYNDVVKNSGNGINIDNAGDNIKIASNELSSNLDTGLLISKIGSNSIQSNVIVSNFENGLKFAQNYVKPNNQDISYNVIYDNYHKDVDAKDTYYQENGQRLDLGDNWYGDWGFVCPKIKTNNLLFKVSQVGKNKFRATFTDSKGNIASLLPDRILTYSYVGQKITMTVKGGIATFTIDAADGDLVSAIVDRSKRDNLFDASIKNIASDINGQSPKYNYPAINYDSVYVMGSNGNNNGGNSNNGISQQNGDYSSNGSSSDNLNPSNNPSNQINSVSQNFQSTSSVSHVRNSLSGGKDQSDVPNSVIKQITIDEDEFFKVTGISFIIVLMILTIAFYYREDIRQMNSKR